ncbi:MAG TPA: hypothetical protein VE422_45995 [Terriglobia bacterium]|nr:hypothetical protein [Terriglobia bacterium]
MQRNDQQLQRAAQKQTIVNSDRDRQSADLLSQMAGLNARLAALREESRQLAQWFAQLDEQQRLLEHLQQNRAAIQNRMGALRRRLAELQQQDPPPADQIKTTQDELDRLERVQADIGVSLDQTGEQLHRLQAQAQAKRGKQEELKSETDDLRGQLRDTQRRLTELLQPAFQDAERLKARENEFKSMAERLKADCGDCDIKLKVAVGDLYRDNPHPRGPLSKLDDRIPFLLLPVRLETIFVPVQAGEFPSGTELWVRVYPDDIAIHTHEKTLTDREVLAGELYWTELVTAEHLRDEKEKRRSAAWGQIVELFGGQRAAWIARQTKPSDWAALQAGGAAQTLLDFLGATDPGFFTGLLALDLSASTRAALQKALADNDADAFSRLADDENWFDRVNAVVRTRIAGFPVHDLTKTDAWTRAPRTNIMPDRFVLLLYPGETAAPREITGNVIPDTLFVGPDPLDSGAGFAHKDGALVFGSAFDWMSDFDKAVAKGMGFRVKLTDAEARNGFAKIIVLGVFLSADARQSAALLEELIDNHQFGPKGFSIVPQGTPTNNTERNGTGYSDNDPYNDLAFFTATDPPAFDPASPEPGRSRTDGRLLADALGIAYGPLQTVQHADQTDLLEACSLSTALFPSTLGYWLRHWMSPVVSEQTTRLTRSFFTQFVTGRGPLPAVRIGNQPYGVLVTSDLSRWKYPQNNALVHLDIFNDQIPFLRNLHLLLSKLEGIWEDIAKKLPFVGKAGSDSSDVLINILGLHPTSVEFFQRIGYSDEYLRNLSNFKDRGRYSNELASLMISMPATARLYLHNLGIDRDLATVGKMKSLHVLWQHYMTSLDAPNLVENKPPSETRKLTFNYIDRLAKSLSTQNIINQDFGFPRPSALLYLMLRNALLLQLHNGSYEWLAGRTSFDDGLQESILPTSLVGMRQSPTLSKLELMTTMVGTAEVGHPSPSTTVADWIWVGPTPTDIEAAFLREQKAALLNLVDTPTARLERCFVEHLDCCNYRLDAWQTGLLAQRLLAQRGSAGPPDNRQTGVHLGAFGWVENVTQSAKVFLSRDSLPTSLRPNDTHPVLEEGDVIASTPARPAGSTRGGFMHAPSISQAAAAAMLRNAYLSHAKPEQAEMFSVNLSSERVRRAEFILEGMRNGQPIEALLGYQFERKLHDRTSESAAKGEVPVLELNEFILPYRQAFPFESRELPQAGTGAPTETIPPYSVVNGLKLTQAPLSSANGYGLATVLPPAERPNANQGAAILAEQNALLDTLDAVKDLLMAENAFQLVRGNFDRVAAVSLAQKDANIPPELEVINTPRGSEFTFTNRVTLHFDDLDPALPASNPWLANLTPRAIAETGMNKWLGLILGAAPEKIRCDVSWAEKAADGTETEHDRHAVTLADLGFQPVDFVWLVSISPEGTGGATELETRIAFHYHRTHNISDDKITRIEFNPAPAAGETTFAQLFPLARHLRALLLESRALHALDFLPAAGGKDTAIPIDKKNPKGYDAADLRSRVQSALNALTALADSIDGPTAPPVELVFVKDPSTPADDETFLGQLGDAFTKLEEARLTFTDSKELTVSFSLADAETLHQKLRAVANFGIGDAFPPESDLTSDPAKAALLARAHRTARRLRRNEPKDGVWDRATDTLNKATPDKAAEQQVILLLEAGRILFGEAFNWLPKFTCHNEIDLATAAADRDQLLKHAVDTTPGITKKDIVDEWLQGLARVRRPLYRWDVVRTLTDALNDVRLELLPVQVPYRAQDSWLAVEFPKDLPKADPGDPPKPFGISRDTLSITAHGNAAFQAGTRQSGVLLDDWTEEIPTAKEITGISFRFNQPNAAPPQTLLLAVTPEETGSWDWDDLVGTLTDTLRRAKRRAVEPEQLEKQGSVWNAFAPALISEFSTIEEADVWLDLMGMLDFSTLNQFYATQSVRS